MALHGKLDRLLEPKQDSVRFYYLCTSCLGKVETVGSSKPAEESLFVV